MAYILPLTIKSLTCKSPGKLKNQAGKHINICFHNHYDINKEILSYNQSKAHINVEAKLQCYSNYIRICKDKTIGLKLFIFSTHRKCWL